MPLMEKLLLLRSVIIPSTFTRAFWPSTKTAFSPEGVSVMASAPNTSFSAALMSSSAGVKGQLMVTRPSA